MVALNNMEARLDAEEASEEERILGVLSGVVADHAAAIMQVHIYKGGGAARYLAGLCLVFSSCIGASQLPVTHTASSKHAQAMSYISLEKCAYSHRLCSEDLQEELLSRSNAGSIILRRGASAAP